jgi:hypothetical protein
MRQTKKAIFLILTLLLCTSAFALFDRPLYLFKQTINASNLSDLNNYYNKTYTDDTFVPYTGATSDVDLGNHNLTITNNEDITDVKTFQIGSSNRLTYSEGYGTSYQTPINKVNFGYTGDTSSKFGMEIVNTESTYYPTRIGIGTPANLKYYGASLSIKGKLDVDRYGITGQNMYFGYSSPYDSLDFYSYPNDITLSTYNGGSFKAFTMNGKEGDITIHKDLAVEGSLDVGNDLDVTGDLTVDEDITSLGLNTGLNQVTQYHQVDPIILTTSDTWYNISWDLLINDETTAGYTRADNNESVTFNYDGIVRVQGCLHPYNNNVGNSEAKLLVRTLIDRVEARCLQASKTKTFKSNGVDILNYVGTIVVETGSKIQVQVRVDNTDLELRGDTDFDNPVSASLNLERISN